MQLGKTYWVAALGAVLLAPGRVGKAQEAKQIVEQAVDTQLAADRNDHTHWRYIETERDGDKFVVVETGHGALKRHIDVDGKPAAASVIAADDQYIQKFIHDPSMQAKQRQNGAHDDKSATELLKLMAQAFIWKVDSQTADSIALSYRPDPSFDPPDMEARVMGAMTGTMIVANPGHHIRMFKGRLENDVTIGFGVLARIKTGSNFDIERREVVPGEWQITETHVHVSGHAMFFKTIGTQEDEVKSDFSRVPPGTTLEQAVGLLAGPAKQEAP